MPDPISLSSVASVPTAAPPPAAKAAMEGTFGAIFADAVDRVENYRRGAEQAVDRLVSGQDEDLHNVAIATQRAELSFELFLQVKNKMVQAYQEIMRMQL